MTRILIIGSGAVGGYIAARLTLSGHDVTLISRSPTQADALRRVGFRVEEFGQPPTTPVPIKALLAAETQRSPAFDLVLFATKGGLDAETAQLISRLLSPVGHVASLQNGLPDAELIRVFGRRRVLGVIVARLGTERPDETHLLRGVPRGADHSPTFLVGTPEGTPAEQRAAVEHLVTILNSVDRTEYVPDLASARWTKLCVNAMRNGLSAASGLGANSMDRLPALRRFGLQLGAEAVAVARARGATVGQVYGLNADLLVRAREDASALGDLNAELKRAADNGSRNDRQRPSMAQDIARQRPTEVREINGVIVRQGEALGVNVDANRHLLDIVQRIERGEAEPSPDHFPLSNQRLL